MEKSFKQLVKQMSEIETDEDFGTMGDSIDRSYQSGKISFTENEVLYKILSKFAELD